MTEQKISLTNMSREQMGDIWKALLGKEDETPKPKQKQ